jgi:hypothetical protein
MAMGAVNLWQRGWGTRSVAFALVTSLAAMLPGLTPALGATEAVALAEGAPAAPASTNAPLKRLSDGRFQLGIVTLDPANKAVSFPAAVNMAEGLVEYAVVTSYGKLHESVLHTEASPADLHAAMLLLGAKGTPGEFWMTEAPPKEIPGDRVEILVTWGSEASPRRVRLEEMILNLASRSAMSTGVWRYTGSRVVEGTFLVQREGSIVAVITDPDALVNNPRPGRDNDEIWQANPKVVPPLGTPVEVTIRLLTEPNSTSTPDLNSTPRK